MAEYDNRNEDESMWNDELTVRQYLLALELAEGEKTGYRAGKNVQDRYGLPSIAAGILYPALEDMIAKGLVEKTEDENVSRRTNNYSLTDEGLEASKRFVEKYEHRVRLSRERLNESEEVE
jgi:DNA-binding PadR family transcriptional regulator